MNCGVFWGLVILRSELGFWSYFLREVGFPVFCIKVLGLFGPRISEVWGWTLENLYHWGKSCPGILRIGFFGIIEDCYF